VCGCMFVCACVCMCLFACVCMCVCVCVRVYNTAVRSKGLVKCGDFKWTGEVRIFGGPLV
jgi:hypothetical protein